MSRAPLISVRARRLSAATPKSNVAWRGLQQEANAENDDPGARDKSDQQSGELHGRAASTSWLAPLYSGATRWRMSPLPAPDLDLRRHQIAGTAQELDD